MKTLIVVNGGDAPGINSAIYHFVRLAEERGDEIVGAMGGLAGVIRRDFQPLTVSGVSPWQAMAGSLLTSSREAVLSQPGARELLLHILQGEAVNQVLLFGGDGTLQYVLPLLHQWEIACIGLPATIDNDVPGTERTLGHDSACNFACAVVDGIRATARALPGRIFTLETLGGATGFLALAVAHAAGADAVLMPEYNFDLDTLANHLRQTVERRGHALVVLSEGVSVKDSLAAALAVKTGIRVRDTRLGHAQRGGAPSHADRLLAADMARAAYEAIQQGNTQGVVVVKGGQTGLRPGSLQGLAAPRPDPVLYTWVNRGLGGNDHSNISSRRN